MQIPSDVKNFCDFCDVSVSEPFSAAFDIFINLFPFGGRNRHKKRRRCRLFGLSGNPFRTMPVRSGQANPLLSTPIEKGFWGFSRDCTACSPGLGSPNEHGFGCRRAVDLALLLLFPFMTADRVEQADGENQNAHDQKNPKHAFPQIGQCLQKGLRMKFHDRHPLNAESG